MFKRNQKAPQLCERNKTRLYITLQHRGGLPGFHWALVLAPKAESASDDREATPCHRFHVTNTAQLGLSPGPNGKFAWRFENQAFNCMTPGNVVGRILVAKLSSTTLGGSQDSWNDQVQRVHDIVGSVPLVQNDLKWTCRVWLEQVLEALRMAGDDFSTIPVVDNDGLTERQVMTFGEKALESIITGKGTIRRPVDLPHSDMRVLSK